MTNARIDELMNKALQISIELMEEASSIEKDTIKNPVNAKVNLKKIEYIKQEGIVLKKITERLTLLSLANALNGEGSD